MAAKILDGKVLATELSAVLQAEVEADRAKTGRVPRIINILIGDHHGSCAYAKSQKRVAERIGIQYELVALAVDVAQQDIEDYIRKLNDDASVNGVMIHKPVPETIDYQKAANCLSAEKDLEGINVTNIGKMMLGATRIIPCTPAAVMEHLKSTGVPLRGQETVVVGASDIVGKPLSLLLLREMATVTVCHIATSEAGQLEEHVRRAAILVVAVGKAGVIPGHWVREGAVVVDVGINHVAGRIVGDVEFEAARQRCGYLTPVPGGVGPVTVMMLMRNAVEAFRAQNQISEHLVGERS